MTFTKKELINTGKISKMERIEIRITSSEKIDSHDLKKFLEQLEKTDFLFVLKIDCKVEIP